MKFVKPCPRIPGTYPCGHRQALQSSVPGFPAHILADTGKFCKALSQDSRHISLRTPANSAKPCSRIPGTHPADTGKFCKALSPGFPAHILADTGKLCKALSPGHGKAGRHDYGYSLQKKTAVKPPSRILFVFLITYGDSKPEGNSLSCKGTCKGW